MTVIGRFGSATLEERASHLMGPGDWKRRAIRMAKDGADSIKVKNSKGHIIYAWDRKKGRTV